MNRMFTPTDSASTPASFPRAAFGASPRTDRATHRFAVVASVGLLGVSLVFRLLWLDRLPGINGDEAWYGVQAMRFVTGQSWTARTPTGLVTNPLLFLSESLLLCFFEPSFWVLRLPIAIWAGIGLALTYVLHRWVFGDRVEAIVVVALTSCLPAHLAYSRFCWDGSFAFVSFPLVVYPLLKFMSDKRDAKTLGLFVVGSLMAVWIHVTHAVLVFAAAMCLLWEFRGSAATLIRRRPITTAAVLVTLAIVIVTVARRSYQAKILFESIASSLDRLPQHLAGLADVLMGNRVYDYVAGVPMPEWISWAYPVFYLATASLLWFLARHGQITDRRLAILTVVACVLLLLAGRALRLHRASYERYFLYLVPLAGLLLVRGVRAMSQGRGERVGPWANLFPLGIALFLVIQFWSCYFLPLRDQRYASRLHRTFLSGAQEPKALLAEAIRERPGAATPGVIFLEDWWLQHSLDFLLAGRCEVRSDTAAADIPDNCFVVGFAGSRFLEEIRAAASDRNRIREERHVGGTAARPLLTLLVLGPLTEIDGSP